MPVFAGLSRPAAYGESRAILDEATRQADLANWLDANRTALETNARNVRENGLWSDGLRLF